MLVRGSCLGYQLIDALLHNYENVYAKLTSISKPQWCATLVSKTQIHINLLILGTIPSQISHLTELGIYSVTKKPNP